MAPLVAADICELAALAPAMRTPSAAAVWGAMGGEKDGYTCGEAAF